MKTTTMLLCCVLSLSLAAQDVTVTFQGNANRNRSYQVVIDDISYYSANSVSTNGKQVTTISNLIEGAHKLDVYVLPNNNSVSSDGSTNTTTATKPVYSKTFQLRQGYDMNILVKGNGLVSFTEKPSTKQLTTQTGTPMGTTAFNKLMQNIKAKRYQSDKIIAIKTAFNTTANYFSAAQVKQLLAMITAESRKLELAKLSYNKVTDKSNFSTVYDVLNSESGRDALDDYVVQQGGEIESTDTNTAYAAMSDADFSLLLTRTRNYSYQADRLIEIKNALNSSSNYFNTAQVKQLLSLVNSETERLALAKTAYPKVTDRNNFNGLVDLFYTQSNRNDLNNFIVSNGGIANNNTYRPAMTDAAFTQVYNKARGHFFQKNTVTEVRTAFTTTANNFSTEQAKRLLQLVLAEPTRLELAKLAYARVVDPANFSQLLDMFTIETNRTDLDNFIRAQ